MSPAEIVACVRNIIGDRRVKLHEPDIGYLEKSYVLQALESHELAYGPFVRRFEDKLCEITGRKYAVALNSGTAALHLAVGVVIGRANRFGVHVPSLTFVATANALTYLEQPPLFCDVGYHGEISSAILGATQAYSVAIEDAAPALGSKGAGTYGRVSIFSFNGNKICTSGGGGSVVTDDQGLAEQIRHLANQAKSSTTEHDAIGFNYRMPNYNAALGLAQLERLSEFLERKAILARRYAEQFGDLFWMPPEGSNNWLNAILLNDCSERDAAVLALNEAGYESRPLHAPLHTLPMYKDCPRGEMTRTMDIWNRCVCLPSGAGLA